MGLFRLYMGGVFIILFVPITLSGATGCNGVQFDRLSWLLDSSRRYLGIFDANIVRSRLCLLTGPTPNDAFNDNKLLIGSLYKIEIVFG